MNDKVSSRIHLSEKPILTLKSLDSTVIQRAGHKPTGFWYGVDGDWERWCRSEMPKWLYHYKYSVDISRANILFLNSSADIYSFTKKYANKDRYEGFRDTSIDWSRVCKDYDGIEIAPYQWSIRLDLMWYYGWDVASGVVWNMDRITIKEVK